MAGAQPPRAQGCADFALVGTTKSTIEQIRERKHWNSSNLVPMDPVTLGLCSQIDLDIEVQRASRGREPAAPVGDTLLPASLTERLTPERRSEGRGRRARRRRGVREAFVAEAKEDGE